MNADNRDWRKDAACRDTDPETFYPLSAALAAPAKTFCNTRCPDKIRQQCLQHALDNDEQFGVWGGLTERERRALAHRKNSYERRHADVDRMVAAGLDANQIAVELGITRKALRTWSQTHHVHLPGMRRPTKAAA